VGKDKLANGFRSVCARLFSHGVHGNDDNGFKALLNPLTQPSVEEQ
jgi:hypothetical protein